MAADEFIAYAKSFNGFNETVGEIFIKFLRDNLSFSFCFIWKCNRKIIKNNFFTVANDIVNKNVGQVGKQVQNA